MINLYSNKASLLFMEDYHKFTINLLTMLIKLVINDQYLFIRKIFFIF